MPKGTVMTVKFQLDGQELMVSQRRPALQVHEAVSFVVNCANQQEIDYYWNKLLAGGTATAVAVGSRTSTDCRGQIVPEALVEADDGRDPARSDASCTP